MRRAMLTASTGPAQTLLGAALPWGTSDFDATGFTRVWTIATSPVAGTVITVKAKFANGGRNIAFFTMDTATRTVRAISTTVSSVAGDSDYTVSLAIAVGDHLAVWQEDVAGAKAGISSRNNGGASIRQQGATAAKPAVGNVIAAGTLSGGLELFTSATII